MLLSLSQLNQRSSGFYLRSNQYDYIEGEISDMLSRHKRTNWSYTQSINKTNRSIENATTERSHPQNTQRASTHRIVVCINYYRCVWKEHERHAVGIYVCVYICMRKVELVNRWMKVKCMNDYAKASRQVKSEFFFVCMCVWVCVELFMFGIWIRIHWLSKRFTQSFVRKFCKHDMLPETNALG